MESGEPFGDEMPNFDICGTVFKELLLGCQYGKPSRGLRLVCLFSFFLLGCQYGKPSRNLSLISSFFNFNFSVSVKVLPVTPLLSGVSPAKWYLCVFVRVFS